MTIDELLAREAIRDTVAKYNSSGDRSLVEDYAACFTRDGIIESTDRKGGRGIYFEGRDAILKWQTEWKSAPKGQDDGTVKRKAQFVRHNLTTCKIDLTGPDTADVRTYWMVITDVGPDHSGVYVDKFRKEDGQWLIAHRKVRTDWFAANSHFGSPS